LAEKILSALKQDIAYLKLIPSGGGCFEVTADQELVYSKLTTGEFPDEQRIVNELARRLRA